MALTQQQGHVLGKCLYIAAAAGVVGAFRQTAHSNEHHAAVSLVLAAGGVAAGLWLHTKLYLSDPTAREEYKRRILLQHFSKSVKDFGLAAILQLVDIDCCREQFLKEFSAGLRFGWVFAAYGAKSLTMLTNANIVRKDDLSRAFEGDLIVARRTADPFTSLWFIVGEASLHYLHANQCLPVAELRRLLDKEYHNPEARSGQVATAPDDVSCGASSDATDATTSGAIRHTFQNILKYGTFCVEVVGVTHKYVITMVQTCPFARTSPYTTLLQEGLLDLYQKGFAESHWCSEKLRDDVRLYRPSLARVEEHVSIQRQLSSGMISSAELFAPVFTYAIPISPFVRSTVGVFLPQHNVVSFIEHYESLLASHGPAIVEPRLWGHVLWVKSEWEKVRSEAQDKFRVESVPQKASRSKHSIAKRTTEQQAADAAVEAAEQLAREKEVAQRKEEFLLSQKKNLHAAFCSRVANAGTSSNWF